MIAIRGRASLKAWVFGAAIIVVVSAVGLVALLTGVPSGAAGLGASTSSSLTPFSTNPDPALGVVATVPVGTSPAFPLYDATNGYEYVTNYRSGNVSILSGTSLVTSVAVGGGPFAAAYDSYHELVFVADETTGNVSVLNGTSFVTNLTAGLDPIWVTYDPGNELTYVVNSGSGSVTVFNGTTTLGNVSVGVYPDSAVYDPSYGPSVDVVNGDTGTVTVINGTTVIGTVSVGIYPNSAAYDPQNGEVYVTNNNSNNVSVISGVSVAATLTVGDYPVSSTYDVSNGLMYIANYGSDNVSVFNGTTFVGAAAVGPDPLYGVYDPATDDVLIANSGVNLTSELNGTSVVATLTVGGGPYQFSYDPANGLTYLTDDRTNQVSVLGFPTPVSTATYPVTFVASGFVCSSHPVWGVTLAGVTESTSGKTIAFTEPNGTYNYTILPPSGYAVRSVSLASPLTVDGSGITVDVTFEKAPTIQTLSITFVERGLPTGTLWCVSAGTTLCSTTSRIQFADVAPGTYQYSVSPVVGYTAEPSSGHVSVQDRSVTVQVNFVAQHRHGCMGM
jgi:YVTN family beta-propeller protein